MSSPAAMIMRGPLLGSLIGAMLYGMTCYQTFFYLRNYPKDRLTIKVMVYIIWFLETNFSNVESLYTIHRRFAVTFMTGMLLNYVNNLYYIWRIWKRYFCLCSLWAIWASSIWQDAPTYPSFVCVYYRGWWTYLSHLAGGGANSNKAYDSSSTTISIRLTSALSTVYANSVLASSSTAVITDLRFRGHTTFTQYDGREYETL
ncbi:hypothetical protein SERLADRAFT_406093 [Serpula lacrymans var. lacrymans S7.9]|uniref:Uncharacterized protein n=1 Tax=Serpula lacrymans var. lacrymans (strain S7.9) TaxID=578457 RepID=F8NLQ2_SERL9|nr:uncharacterized protein SERLADRAFT_406093 [Serpula lacrymans var. lacrymans S7.9]EGO28604.1 hypothetical protein SERLADRAFT_406093 [Serpula lacrymans var. lacrymans S7.9]